MGSRKIAIRAFAPALIALAVSTGSSAQVSNDVIRIGVLDDMSGLYADLTGQGGVLAARMAVEDVGGSVLGKRIEVVVGDHQNKADVGSAIARKWLQADDVDMVMGLNNSAVALSVQKLAWDLGKVSIAVGPGTTELTGKQCSPHGFHWVYDTYALSNGTAGAVLKNGGRSWYFVTADYAFGHSLEKNAGDLVRASGGQVVGSVRHPINSADFSSFLLQAQGSKAQVIGLANAGKDLATAVKQAAEFQVIGGGQQLVGLGVTIFDIHSIGLKLAQGLTFTEAFYWDQNAETRAFSRRFMERHRNAPTMLQAGMYSAMQHYLKAVKEAGTDEPKAVLAKMRELPINDFMTRNGRIREDGRVIRDMYLLQVKKPEESAGAWDYMRVLSAIPGEQAFRPLSQSECPLVKK
jgi:branched-chain amino acid transport system substrate-binding protein